MFSYKKPQEDVYSKSEKAFKVFTDTVNDLESINEEIDSSIDSNTEAINRPREEKSKLIDRKKSNIKLVENLKNFLGHDKSKV